MDISFQSRGGVRMDRRTFLKVLAGGWRSSRRRPGSRLRPEPRPCRDARAEDRANHRDAQHLSVLRRLLRRHHPHARRQGEERQSRRSSTSKATPIIRSAAAASARRAPRSRTTSTTPNRLTSRKVRRPGSDHWEDISWDEAIAGHREATSRTRATRPSSPRTRKGETVNRTPGMAWIGGCTDTNEFNWLQFKALTAWGVPYRDTQARV